MMSKQEVKCYEAPYDKELFYSKMGRFFAEERYRRQMPYLRNESDRVWFTVEKDNRVVAFSSLRIMDKYILFTTEYVESGYRRKGLFKALTEARFAYCRELENMPIRTSTDLVYIKEYYLGQGFDVYRTTKKYWFLQKNKDKEELAYESRLALSRSYIRAGRTHG